MKHFALPLILFALDLLLLLFIISQGLRAQVQTPLHESNMGSHTL